MRSRSSSGCDEAGYPGGLTIVNMYVRQIRPPKRKAFLKLTFARGECAQIDWGEYGSIAVGSTRRRLSFFVMVLCYSRQMYVEFTVSQTMEHFLGCHERAFAVLGVPTKIMVDNLKSAVLRRLTGAAPVFNPRYLDYARHHAFKIAPCNVAAGNEKGRVESGVGYVKKNFLNGTEFTDFSAVNPAAQAWLNEIANVRIHGETHRRPVDLFAEERGVLRAANPNPYDLARVLTLRASSQFRITLDTNRYSVPAEFANQPRDREGLSGAGVHLPPGPAHRPACSQLRSVPGHRGSGSPQGTARAAQERPRAAPAARSS